MDKFAKIRDNNLKEAVKRFNHIMKTCEDIKLLVESKEKLKVHNMVANPKTFEKYTKDLKEINEKIKKALVQNGYSEDYLDPIYTCKICKDNGFVYTEDFEKKVCVCNVDKSKFTVGFDDVDTGIFSKEITGDNKKSHYDFFMDAFNYAKDYVKDFPVNDKINILLYGASGRGKSYLASAICKEVYSKGYSVCKVDAFKLIEDFKNKHVNDTAYSDDYFNCDLLVIDDIGTEPIYKNVSIEYLFALLNERINKKRHTIFITNLSYSNCAQRYDERIASRIFDDIDTKRIALMGDNLRLVKKQ